MLAPTVVLDEPPPSMPPSPPPSVTSGTVDLTHIPPEHLAMLCSNPSENACAEFDMVYGAGASAAILGGIAGGGEPAAEEPMGPGEPERKEEVAPEIKEEAAPERRQEAADSKKKAAKTTAAGGAGVDYKLAAKPSPPEANPVEGSLVPLSVLQAEKARVQSLEAYLDVSRALGGLSNTGLADRVATSVQAAARGRQGRAVAARVKDLPKHRAADLLQARTRLLLFRRQNKDFAARYIQLALRRYLRRELPRTTKTQMRRMIIQMTHYVNAADEAKREAVAAALAVASPTQERMAVSAPQGEFAPPPLMSMDIPTAAPAAPAAPAEEPPPLALGMDMFGGMDNPWATLISDSLDKTIEKHEPRWEMLELLAGAVGSLPSAGSVASLWPAEVRMEAARKLIKNHVAVLKDITNPSPSTQRELTRVPRADGEDVDRFLLELARRLLGSRAHGLPEARAADLLLKAPLDVANRKQCDTYSASARYLSRRIQSQPEQKKGRVPDMSEAAAEAFKAVAFEVGEADPKWRMLRSYILADGATPGTASGEAGQHPAAARCEAARRLINNHNDVLDDICNESASDNIVGEALTQTELCRVPAAYRPQVDAMLRETARRLWGKNPSPEAFSLWQCLEETAEGVGVAEEEGRAVWRAVAVYLSGRLQTTPDQKSPSAALLEGHRTRLHYRPPAV
uniref:Uncharacterized protein n=1 Tax=Emiliania huxleyi TaxID=2903 RepID=A0A7S3TWR4_EMIHU